MSLKQDHTWDKERTNFIMNKRSWPLGPVPKEFQRQELELVKKAGYSWNDAREIIDLFEKKVANFAGAKYGVAVDSCTHGLFLTFKWFKDKVKTNIDTLILPKNTFVSVPMQALHVGFKVVFKDIEWSGSYEISPLEVFDGAARWREGMFQGKFYVISFQYKKRVPIGRGGMILTDDLQAANWFRKVSYDSRDLTKASTEQDVDELGYHFYMTPEDAARGILLMDKINRVNNDSASYLDYNDLSKMKLFL